MLIAILVILIVVCSLIALNLLITLKLCKEIKEIKFKHEQYLHETSSKLNEINYYTKLGKRT